MRVSSGPSKLASRRTVWVQEEQSQRTLEEAWTEHKGAEEEEEDKNFPRSLLLLLSSAAHTTGHVSPKSAGRAG